MRWHTGANFWRATLLREISRPTRLSSLSLELWSTQIPARTFSPGADQYPAVIPKTTHLTLYYTAVNYLKCSNDPPPFLSRISTHLSNIIPDFTDNNLINIVRYGEDYYASSEINYMNQIDPATLETVGRVSYSPLASSKIHTAFIQALIFLLNSR